MPRLGAPPVPGAIRDTAPPRDWRRFASRVVPVIAILAAWSGTQAATATATDPLLLEERIAHVERILANQQGGTELMLFVQRLQQELQALRGQVEMMGFEIERLRQQQTLGGIGRSETAPDPASPDQAGGFAGGPGTSADDLNGSSALRDPRPTLPADDPALTLDDPGLAPPADFSRPDPLSQAPRPPTPGGLGIPTLPSPETSSGSERELYRAAFDLLKERDYGAAIDAFHAQLRQYPRGEFADTGRYWLGETYYARRDLPAALNEFERLIEFSPDSPRIPGALLKIGYILDEQQQPERARATLQQLLERHPASTEARLARDRLERLGSGPAR